MRIFESNTFYDNASWCGKNAKNTAMEIHAFSFFLKPGGEQNLLFRIPLEIWDFVVLTGQDKSLFSLTGDKRSLRYTPLKEEEVRLLVLFKEEYY